MTVQTLTLGRRKFVVIPEKDFRRLQQKADAGAAPKSSRSKSKATAQDQRDASILRRRLADMRRRNEKPIPYAQARKELGLE